MYIYIVASGNGLFKIGKSTKVKERVRGIKSASPVECELFYFSEYDSNSIDLEKELHVRFEKQRVRGEWFALTKDDLLSIIPEDAEITRLLEDMESWGFFTLGLMELRNNGVKVAMFRMEAVMSSKITRK